MISSWQQKNKNGIDFNKALRTIEGEMLTAKNVTDLIATISKIANLVQSSPKVLVTSETVNKWKKMIELNSLLTAEVLSSFSVLESEIALFLNRKTDELNKFNAIKDYQSLMIKSEEENNLKLKKEYLESEKAYGKSVSNNNNISGKKRKGIEEINNSNIDGSNSSTTSSSSSSSSTSNRKKHRKNKTDNNNNNVSIDLSVGARELMMDGFLHLIVHHVYNAGIFIPLKYQTMIEISAYGGFDLAIGLCHIFGFGNFIKDAEKGYNIITKYYENNKNDSLSQNILGFLHYIEIEPLNSFGLYAYGEYWLGRCYYHGAGYLGHAYKYGIGVAKDEKKAFEWYKNSSEQGFAQGQHEVGQKMEKKHWNG